jgi:Uma2 family endonuclease
MSTPALVPIEQFEQMLRESDVDYEFDNGELIPLSSGTYWHTVARNWVVRSLMNYMLEKRCGVVLDELDFRLSDQQVRRPDVAVLTNEKRVQIDPERVPINVIPDLVVEVISKNDKWSDVDHKVTQYLQAGVQEVWLVVLSERHVYVRRNGEIRVVEFDGSLSTPTLPGFTLPVATIFDESRRA